MTMKSILAVVEESDGLESVLETALQVGRQFGSLIEGLHVRPAEPAVVSDGFAVATPDLVENFERQTRERAARVRVRFDDFMRQHAVRLGEDAQPADEPVARWDEQTAMHDDLVGSRGRLFDLIVVGRPVRRAPSPTMSTLESALFESGRPVLIAPPTPPAGLGKTVVIGWNGSTETARTIAFSMPFLASAQRVVVLSITDGMVPGPAGVDVSRQLMRNGIAAEAIDAESGSRSVGEAILGEAAGLGADLLVKGAYTHSRLRQMIFGGATSHILSAAEIPVFMAH